MLLFGNCQHVVASPGLVSSFLPPVLPPVFSVRLPGAGGIETHAFTHAGRQTSVVLLHSSNVQSLMLAVYNRHATQRRCYDAAFEFVEAQVEVEMVTSP